MSRVEREGFVSEHGTDCDVLVLFFLVLACCEVTAGFYQTSSQFQIQINYKNVLVSTRHSVVAIQLNRRLTETNATISPKMAGCKAAQVFLNEDSEEEIQ